MKQCTKCKEWKDGDQFYKHKRHQDGLSSQCKECMNIGLAEYRNSAYGKDVMRRYRYSGKGKEDAKKHAQHYRNTEKGKETKRRNRQNEKGKAGRTIRVNRWRTIHPQRYQAQRAVQKAVERGKFPHVSTYQCQQCNRQAEHYHHWSYEKEHWFDVIPLCLHCHSRLHKGMDQ